MFRTLRWRIGTIWCSLAHESPMWPIHGHYQCRRCGRRYPAFAEAPIAMWTRPIAWKPVGSLMLAMVLATFVRPVEAADTLKEFAAAEAEAALGHYTACGHPTGWAIESVEIHASLPKLETTGWLLAIRHLAPNGESRYEVLRLGGDRKVREQVIARYLNAEERASAMPGARLAITPANYKFTYKSAIDDGERLAYAFQITPRRKRDGLIQGELWLDQRTGVLVLQSGHLVKSPSVFIRRVVVTRENALRDGVIESRLTHIAVETRLIGRAELVIKECPLSSADAMQLANGDTPGGPQ